MTGEDDDPEFDDAYARALRALIDETGIRQTPGAFEDRCRACGRLVGFGIPAFHVGICDACRVDDADDRDDVADPD
jgi:hypothetical protein